MIQAHSDIKEHLNEVRYDMNIRNEEIKPIEDMAGRIFKYLYASKDGPRYSSQRKKQEWVDYECKSSYSMEPVEIYNEETGEVRTVLSWRMPSKSRFGNVNAWPIEHIQLKDTAIDLKRQSEAIKKEITEFQAYGKTVMNEYRTEVLEQMFEYY